MAPFYSRYIPSGSSTTNAIASRPIGTLLKKRRLDLNSNLSQNNSKKTKITNGAASRQDRANEEQATRGVSPAEKQAKEQTRSIARDDLNVSGADRGNNKKSIVGGEEQNYTQEINSVKHKKRKKEKRPKADETVHSPEDRASPEQHVRIRARYKNATKLSQQAAQKAQLEEPQNPSPSPPPKELHGLEPFPQPPPVERAVSRPTFSSLPPWLSHPTLVDADQTLNFRDLGLDSALLANIQQQGLKKALAVQKAIIPLLLKTNQEHFADICISAATGSGKTLAYLLPLIQKVRNMATRKLKAVIVVPTRELVKQARDTCEACTVGINVKIATALGSKSLRDEQDALMERYEVWNPEEYHSRQNALIDWSTVALDKMIAEDQRNVDTTPDFVARYRSKVDILICTPGRLVDHIRSTEGFTLDDVEWLVIDEADRLLNESFQEWIEVVIPALESRASQSPQDEILQQMRFELPPRVVHKVMLGATMTSDVSKLHPLKLQQPTLVVVGSSTNSKDNHVPNGEGHDETQDEHPAFRLPPNLTEQTVSVGSGAEKPLYLLQLLRTQVDVFNLRTKKDEDNRSSLQTELGAEEQDASTSESDTTESTSDSESVSSISSVRPETPTKGASHHQPKSKQQNESSALPFDKDTPRPNTVLIFTRSDESATRLSRLLSLLSKPIFSLTAVFTKSTMSSASSRRALRDLRQRKIRIIIATDRASRGLDLPELGHVISYDVPTSLTTYVHRVGRTARAGKSGMAWTLLAHHEARWFWREVVGTGNTAHSGDHESSQGDWKEGGGRRGFSQGRIVRGCKVRKFDLQLDLKRDVETRERYEKALKQLGEEVAGRGESTTAGMKSQ